MKKLYLTLLISIISISIFAQYEGPTPPNYKDIEININTRYDYNDLMKRYLAGDENMDIDEQRHLYYGYIFQPQYNPTDTSKYNNEMSKVLNRKFLSEDDYNSLERSAKALLSEDPFNLRAINTLLLVYAQNDNAEQYKIATQKKGIIQRAIASSGNGMTKKSAYYVIKVAHEYDILSFLGFKYGGSEKLERNCKCNSVTVASNPFDVEKIYFNIAPAMDYAKRKGDGKFIL